MWLRYPEDVDQQKLAELAAARNVHFAPGANFHINNDDRPYLRLAFGHVPDQDIRDGIPLLARSIREARTSNAPKEFGDLYD